MHAILFDLNGVAQLVNSQQMVQLMIAGASQHRPIACLLRMKSWVTVAGSRRSSKCNRNQLQVQGKMTVLAHDAIRKHGGVAAKQWERSNGIPRSQLRKDQCPCQGL